MESHMKKGPSGPEPSWASLSTLRRILCFHERSPWLLERYFPGTQTSWQVPWVILAAGAVWTSGLSSGRLCLHWLMNYLLFELSYVCLCSCLPLRGLTGILSSFSVHPGSSSFLKLSLFTYSTAIVSDSERLPMWPPTLSDCNAASIACFQTCSCAPAGQTGTVCKWPSWSSAD